MIIEVRMTCVQIKFFSLDTEENEDGEKKGIIKNNEGRLMQERGQGRGNKNKRKKLTRMIKCRCDLAKAMEPKK